MPAKEHCRDCGNHFLSLHFVFSHIMEMRPIGRKESLLSKNTIYTFPKRKDLEIERKGPSNIFLLEQYGKHFISLDIA